MNGFPKVFFGFLRFSFGFLRFETSGKPEENRKKTGRKPKENQKKTKRKPKKTEENQKKRKPPPLRMARTPRRQHVPATHTQKAGIVTFWSSPTAHQPPNHPQRPTAQPLFIHNQSDSQRQWITFNLICVPRARARGSKFHAETNFSLFSATEKQQRQMISFQPPGPSQPPTHIVSARPSPPWAAEQPAPPQNAQISRSAVLPTTKHAQYLNCPGANRDWTVADF